MVATVETAGKSGSERRQYKRLVKNGHISYWLVDGGRPNAAAIHRGTILDLGAGGVRFLVEEQVGKNALLGMTMEFIGWRLEGEELVATGNKADVGTMEMVGYVMWQTPSSAHFDKYEIGVRFSSRFVKE